METQNPNKTIKIEKLTLNIGAGKEQDKLEKGMKLLKMVTGISPVKTFATKRIPNWGLRPGLPIGCKITLRGIKAEELLKRLLQAKDNVLKESQFDNNGNLSFGIHEYIDIPGVKYDPQIKVMGLEACITLQRNGFRVKKRRIKAKKINKNHLIKREEAIEFMQKNFGITIGE